MRAELNEAFLGKVHVGMRAEVVTQDGADKAYSATVTRIGDDIILNMPSNITFDTDQAAIKPQFFDTLNSVAIVLNEFNKTLVDVTGHTDSTGSPQHNQVLSEQRAGSVADYLISQGNNPKRFQAIGMGPNDPIASNATPEGRAQIRRVEIKIVPLT